MWGLVNREELEKKLSAMSGKQLGLYLIEKVKDSIKAEMRVERFRPEDINETVPEEFSFYEREIYKAGDSIDIILDHLEKRTSETPKP